MNYIKGVPVIKRLEKDSVVIEPCRDKEGNIYIPLSTNIAFGESVLFYLKISKIDELPLVEPK